MDFLEQWDVKAQNFLSGVLQFVKVFITHFRLRLRQCVMEVHTYVCVTVWCREKWSVILTVKQIHSTRSHWDQNWPTGHILSHSSNDSCVYSSGAYQPVLITWTIWFQEGEKQRGQQNLIWIWVGYALYRMPMLSDFKSEFHFAVGPLLW